MQPLTLPLFILLLTAALCSCRTARQSASESTDSTEVEIKEAKTTLSTDEILSLLNSSRELDLSGITVEFFPPDTAHPGSKPAPRSLTIDRAKGKEQFNAATHQMASIEEKDTVNVSLRQSSAKEESTQSASDIARPSDQLIYFIIIAAIIIATILLIIKLKHRSH